MYKEIIQFTIAFIGAIIWYRLVFLIAPVYFKKPLIRSVLKLRWHHLHHGVLVILVAVMGLLFVGKNSIVIVLFGIGLGLMVDLFIPALLLETDREEELVVYRKSLVPTLFLAIGIIVLIFLLKGLY